MTDWQRWWYRWGPTTWWYRFGWPRLKAEVDWWIRGLPQGHPLRKRQRP